ncbi:transposase, partial [Moorena sp. SIO3F7]
MLVSEANGSERLGAVVVLHEAIAQLKNGCNWCDLPKDLPPYSTVFWYYKQWREQGVIENLRDILH